MERRYRNTLIIITEICPGVMFVSFLLLTPKQQAAFMSGMNLLQKFDMLSR